MPETPGKSYPRQQRDKPGPVTTLGELHKSSLWLMAYCTRTGCNHGRPISIAWGVIRWGSEAPSNVLRRNLVCEACGHRGAMLQGPSWSQGLGMFGLWPVK
jgi:hypothetical protein